jgi:hypothetical protein
MGALPIGIIRKDVAELCARARLGHHRSDDVAPDLVVFRFFVGGRRFGSAISFDEHETGWIILLLEDVESRDAGFFEALASVGEGRLFEGFDVFGLQMNVDVNDEHNQNVKALKR